MGILSRLRRRTRRRWNALFGSDRNSGGTAAVEVVTSAPINGQFEFSADAYNVLEATGYVSVWVNRTTGADGAVSVQYATGILAAVFGITPAVPAVDYTHVSGTLSWANGDNTAQLILIPILLTDVPGNFKFTITLSNPTGGATLVVSPEVATIEIIRRSRGEAAFPPGQWYKQEVNPGPSNVSLLVQRNLAFKGVVGVSWHTVDGTAVAGLDYTASSGTLSWTDGDGSPKTINVPVLFRSGAQADRDFNVVIDTPTGGIVIGSPATANVIISDGAPAGTNPTAGASIKSQIINEVYFGTSDILLAEEEMYTNRNILVMAGHGRSLSRRFNGIFAFDASTAWAVGNLGYITRTVNGGTNWTEEVSGITTHLRAVSFVSALIGWAVGDGGVILKTTDGGDTWVAQASGVTKDLYAVEFASSTVGWAVGDTGVILGTTDGGATWALQTSGTSKDLRGISSLNASDVWVVGKTGTVLRTANGGTSWAPQTSTVTVDLNGVSAVDATHVWAVGNHGTIIFHNGTTWATQTSGVTVNLNSIAMASLTVGWAVGNTGTIRVTADGVAWASQTSSIVENLASVSAASTSVAYIAGHQRLQKTVNGGTNWLLSIDVVAAIGFGGYSAGGAGSTGGLDIIGLGESFLPVSSRSFQGDTN